MSTKETSSMEELNKSIDALIEDIFSEETEDNKVEKASPIDIAQDAKTTADAAVNQAPSSQKDESRGAGRPKQISDVPQTDMDGRRDSEYDASTTENENKEDEPEETEQSPSIDQTSEGKGRMKGEKAAAPKNAPFKKSETGDSKPESLSDEEWQEFQEFKKSKMEAKQEELRKSEELKKMEAKKEQEELIKSAVYAALEPLKKENEELKKSFNEQSELIKAMASQPKRPKSITGIEQLEKSMDGETTPTTFSKSEKLDAAFELAKSGKISDTIVSELEMTGYVSDPEARTQIEKYLYGN